MTAHHHYFGEHREGRVAMCRVRAEDSASIVAEDCTEMRVAVGGSRMSRYGLARSWRPLTSSEQIDVLAIMMEDVAIMQAMQIIHGRVEGEQRARQALGYS